MTSDCVSLRPPSMSPLPLPPHAQDSWLSVGRWESDPSHSHWPDFPEVLGALASAADARIRAAAIPTDPAATGLGGGKKKKKKGVPGIVAFYVCGSDHARKCGLSRGFKRPRTGVVIVPRAGDPPGPGSDRARLVFSVADPDADCADLSSSKFHAAIGDGNREAAAHIVGPSAFRYLASNSLLGCSPADAPTPSCVPAGIDPSVAPQRSCGTDVRPPAGSAVGLTGQSPAVVVPREQRKRLAFITASALSRIWRTVDRGMLDDALFVFGSKRWGWLEA